MKTEDRLKAIKAYRRGYIQTDSDVLDLAEFLGYPPEVIQGILFREMARGTSCEGCRNVGSRFHNSPTGPCAKCTRRDPEWKDRFEPEWPPKKSKTGRIMAVR